MALSLGRATANTTVRAAQLNQLIDLLEGASGENIALLLRAASGNDLKFVLSDAAGARKLQILDSAEASVFSVDSDGNIVNSGSYTPTIIILPGEASPSTTTAGSLRRDTDDHILVMGTGSAAKRLGLVVGSGAAPAVTGEMAYDTATGAFKLYDGSAAVQLNSVRKYASATQTVSASTAFVDAIAAGSPATFTVAIGANEVWQLQARLRFVFTGTGGLKMQVTGPAAPTAVRISGHIPTVGDGGVPGFNSLEVMAVTSAFSSAFGAFNAAANTTDTYNTTDSGGFVDLDVFIVNGANAGSVTLQIAQNSANGTTVLQIGSWLRGERWA